jgi:hypothetical protein
MNKHTPAPLIVSSAMHGPGNGILHIQANDPFEQDLCTVWAASLVKPEQHEANARLMAAAPELLAALKALRDACMGMVPECAEQVDAAIAKAEGTPIVRGADLSATLEAAE